MAHLRMKGIGKHSSTQSAAINFDRSVVQEEMLFKEKVYTTDKDRSQ